MFGNATARTNIFLLPIRTYALNWKLYATCLMLASSHGKCTKFFSKLGAVFFGLNLPVLGRLRI